MKSTIRFCALIVLASLALHCGDGDNGENENQEPDDENQSESVTATQQCEEAIVEGTACEQVADCPSITCFCDDGSANTGGACFDGECISAPEACASASPGCREDEGDWTGDCELSD